MPEPRKARDPAATSKPVAQCPVCKSTEVSVTLETQFSRLFKCAVCQALSFVRKTRSDSAR
jgi:transcription initiation factor IIE alpha subunit